MVFADCLSAWALSRRAARVLSRKGSQTQKLSAAPLAPGKFSSRKAAAVFVTLIKVYAALLLAHGIDVAIIDNAAGFSAMKFVAGAVCAWQLLSILENEASLNGASWARIARRYLIDKASRHLGFPLDL